MFGIRKLLIGKPLATSEAIHTRLPKFLALPVFASDALSSVAYATEEIMIALSVLGAASLQYVLPTSFAIVVLLFIVAASYRQTIHAYPNGGGSYIVAKENLGVLPGLIAASALLIDYVLTVAVSISAGVKALTSLFPALQNSALPLCLAFLALVALLNLRGAKESGAIFATFTYSFLTVMFLLIGVGLFKAFILRDTGAIHHPVEVVPPTTETLGVLLFIKIILRAFAAGCTAMTGVEAVSNGVPAFRPPESKNAATTLVWMAVILAGLFLGTSVLAHAYGITPSEAGETVVSQLGRAVFGDGLFHGAIQIATCCILILAANTSFADFPRLSSLIARDGYAPRQLAQLGDRLVFQNGIIILSVLSGGLIVYKDADTHALIPLYAVGVFLSFTLSQSGMVMHWLREGKGILTPKTLINAVGAVTTGVVTIVIASTKFTHGAWLVVVWIPVLVLVFQSINKHYQHVRMQLRVEDDYIAHPAKHSVIVLVPSVNMGSLQAIEYARSISENARGVFVEIDPQETPRIISRWEQFSMGLPLVILESRYRSLLGPVMQYLAKLKAEEEFDMVTVIVPEFVTRNWFSQLLHNKSALVLKIALMFQRDVVMTNVRYYLK